MAVLWVNGEGVDQEDATIICCYSEPAFHDGQQQEHHKKQRVAHHQQYPTTLWTPPVISPSSSPFRFGHEHDHVVFGSQDFLFLSISLVSINTMYVIKKRCSMTMSTWRMANVDVMGDG